MIPPRLWPYRKPDTAFADAATSPAPRALGTGSVLSPDDVTTPRKAGNPGLLTTDEAAHYLRVSKRTMERWRCENSGPRFVKAGAGKRARVFYRVAELDAWLVGLTFGSTAEYGR